jgi:site-specific DNA-methyltransferase (adenine-specific)
MKTNIIYNEECLRGMSERIEDSSIDAIIADPPYGTTACSWDSVIPFDLMWEQINRIIKPNGAIVLFGSEPFSSALRMSNIKNYKYDWIWDKPKGSGFLNAKKRPLRHYETISVFSYGTPIYYPQGLIEGVFNNSRPASENESILYGKQRQHKESKFTNYPKDIIKYSKPHKPVHPTQKPTDLLEYLICTYTNENETVLDFTMGSGTTAIACLSTNRKFIGFEIEEKYYNIALKRIGKFDKKYYEELPEEEKPNQTQLF